jgi:hypothetical protein
MEIAASPDGSHLYVSGYNSDYQFHGAPFDMRIATVAYRLREDGEALPEPEELWTRIEDGPMPGRGVAYPRGVVVSPDGGTVFVAGFSEDAETGPDFITLAYDAATGERQWLKREDGAGGVDGIEAMAISPDGSTVFVTGPSAMDTNGSGVSAAIYDGVTIAYDSATGQERWRATYAARPGGSDYPASMALAPDGSTVLVGMSSAGSSAGSDLVAVAYNAATGTQRWAARASGADPSGGDLAMAIATDGVRAYLAGASPEPANGYDSLIVAFDLATGAERWRSGYAGAARGTDSALDVLAHGGAVYAAGFETLADGYADALVWSLDAATGAVRWTRREDAGGQDDVAAQLVASPDGTKLFTSGNSSTPETEQDFLTQSFDAATGEVRWTRSFDLGFEYHFELAAAGDAVFSTGLTGENTGDFATVAYDLDTGAQRWVAAFDGTAHAQDETMGLVAAPDGSAAYVTGTSSSSVFGGYRQDIATVAYSGADGSVLWEHRFDGGGSDQAGGVAFDAASGRVFVTGSTQTEPERFALVVVAYDAATGRELWSKAVHQSVSAQGLAIGVIDGDVVVTGCSHPNAWVSFTNVGCWVTDSDLLTVALDGETGQERWRDVYDAPAHGRDEGLTLAVDAPSGTVVVTGISQATDDDYATIAYDAASGSRRWLSRYDGGANEVATGIDISSGSAIVTGVSAESFATIGYDLATGAQEFALRVPTGLFSELGPRISSVGSTAYVTLPSLHLSGVMAIDIPTGTPRWLTRFANVGLSPLFNPASLDATAGEVVVTGNSAGWETVLDIAYGTMSFDAATGALRWVAGHNARGGTSANAGPADIPTAVTIGGSRAFVTGDTGYYSDFLTVSYDLG